MTRTTQFKKQEHTNIVPVFRAPTKSTKSTESHTSRAWHCAIFISHMEQNHIYRCDIREEDTSYVSSLWCAGGGGGGANYI